MELFSILIDIVTRIIVFSFGLDVSLVAVWLKYCFVRIISPWLASTLGVAARM